MICVVFLRIVFNGELAAWYVVYSYVMLLCILAASSLRQEMVELNIGISSALLRALLLT